MRARDRVSLGITWLALAASVLIVGGALWWAEAIAAGLVAVALLIQISTRRRLARLSPLLVLLGVGTVLTALQLFPLPKGVVAAFNPVGEGLREDGAALLNISPWSAFSMDPPTTLRSLSYFVTLLGAAVLALRFSGSERGRYYLICGVAGTCGLAAAVTGLHALFEADSLFGLYAPRQAAPPLLGPLLNPNNLGCLMAFGTSLSVGLTFYQRQSSQLRVLWLTNAVGCALIAVGSESRGAVIGLALGLVATFAMMIGARVTSNEDTRSSKRPLRAHDFSVFIVVAIALGVAIYLTAGDVATEIDNTSYTDAGHTTSKFEAWKSSTALIAESPWIGVGRGAVEGSLTRVHPASAYATFSHLENEYVSAIVEWGIPGALLAFIAFGWCVVSALRRWRDSPLAAGVLGGLLCIVFQSSVDFGIQLLGVALPVIVAAATVLLVPFRESVVLRRTRALRIGLVVAIVLCGTALIPRWARTLGEDHEKLAAASLAEVREIATRHPIDYMVYARAAQLSAPSDTALAVRLINHSMRLHPYHSGLHRLAARVLLARGHTSQAQLEYRLALHGTRRPLVLLREIVKVFPAADDAAAAIPNDWSPYTEVLTDLTQLQRGDVGIAWLRRITATSQRDTLLLDRLYEIANSRDDLDAAAYAASRRIATADTSTSRLMLGRVEYKLKHYEKVLSVLRDVAQWRSRIDEKGEAWLLTCQAQNDLGRIDDAIYCLQSLERSSSVTPALTRRALQLRKEIEEGKSNANGLRLLSPQARFQLVDPSRAPSWVVPAAPQ